MELKAEQNKAREAAQTLRGRLRPITSIASEDYMSLLRQLRAFCREIAGVEQAKPLPWLSWTPLISQLAGSRERKPVMQLMAVCTEVLYTYRTTKDQL